MAELKHKWRVRRGAWFIRLYVYAWSVYSVAERHKLSVSDSDITFCKLFWGYLLMPLAFLVVKPLFHVVDSLVWVATRIPRRRAAALDTGTGTGTGAAIDVPYSEPERAPSRILTLVSDAFVRLSLQLQAVWLRVRRPVLWVAVVVAGVLASAGMGVVVYLVATHFDVVMVGAGYGAIGVTGAAMVVLFVVGLERLGVLKRLELKVKRSGQKAKHGTLGFAGVMRVGYHAVKTNTCPEIVLDESE